MKVRPEVITFYECRQARKSARISRIRALKYGSQVYVPIRLVTRYRRRKLARTPEAAVHAELRDIDCSAEGARRDLQRRAQESQAARKLLEAPSCAPINP